MGNVEEKQRRLVEEKKRRLVLMCDEREDRVIGTSASSGHSFRAWT